MLKLKQIVIIFSIFTLCLTQVAQALTLQEIIQGYDNPQGQVLGASTPAKIGSVQTTSYGKTLTFAATNGVAQGHTVVIALSSITSLTGSHWVSCSDSSGNSYTRDASAYNSSIGQSAMLCSAYVATAIASGGSITITLDTADSLAGVAYDLTPTASTNRINASGSAVNGYSSSFTVTASGGLTATSLLIGAFSIGGTLSTFTNCSSLDANLASGGGNKLNTCWAEAGSGTPSLTLTPSSAGQSASVLVAYTESAGTPPPADTTAPTVPTGLSATAVSSSSINLSWSASTDAVGVTGYKVYRAGTQIGTTASTSYSDTGLSASTSYSYTVAAYDAAGNTSSQSSSASATTQSAPVSDTTAPTVPANLSASAVSSSAINLSWSASTDAVGVTGYKVYRAGTQIGTTASTNYSDTGLSASTSYSYTVAAYDAAGNTSAQSSSASATTQAAPVGGSANYYISPSGNDSNSCTSTGSPCLTINGALQKAGAGQTIEMAAGTYGAQNISASKSSPGVTVKCVSVNSGATSNACKTGAINAGGSWYTIQDVTIDVGDTVHGSGWGASGSNITFKNVKLHGDFAAGYMSAGTSNFTWDGGEWGDQNNLGGRRSCANQDGYYLYMLGDTAITNITLKNMDVWPMQIDATPCNGDPLHMETIRIDGNINGMLIDSLNFHDGAQDNTGTIFFSTFRGTPNNVTIQNSYLGTDGNSSIIFGGGTNINIRYNTIAGGISQPNLVSNLTVTGNAGWWQSFAGCIGTHVKNVWQWDSNFSCGSDKIVTGPQYSLSNLGLSNSYVVQASSPLINAGETSCAVTKDILGNTRPVGAACDAGANEYGSVVAPPTDTTAPTVPTNLSATAVSSSQINLSWTASTDAVGVTGYDIYRNSSLLTSVTGTTYSNTGLTPSTQYSYTVRAKDAAGNTSAQSTSVSATTQAPPLTPDVTAPTVALTSPSSGTVSGTITLSATASDPSVGGAITSGLSLLTITIDGNVYATSSSGSLSKTLDTTTLTNSSHSIVATAKDSAGNQSTSNTTTITVNNAAATKYPRTITLTSLEGLSAIPNNQSITVTILSGSTVLETQNLTPNASKQYTVTFLSSDPQLVNIRFKVAGYLSQLLSNIDTTINSPSSLTVNPLLAGDLNDDNTINTLDYSALNARWNQNYPASDINKDGLVNSLDYGILKNNWGKVGQ